MANSKLWLWAGVVVAICVLTGCSKESGDKEPVVTVQMTTARKGPIQLVIETEAVLYPRDQAAITPKVTSPVRQFLVNRGSHVKQGQLLAVLENKDLSAAVTENKGALEQAQAAYATTTGASVPEEAQKAELDVKSGKEALDAQQKLYDSRQQLFQQGALPRKDLDQASVALVQAKSQFELAEQHLKALQAVSQQSTIKSAAGQLSSAQGKLEGASAQLSYTEIRSPINGVVTDRPSYPGETPPQGTPLLTIMDTSSVVAKAHIPQSDAAQLKVGNPATITSGDAEDTPSKVTLVSPATDPNSTTVEVWIEAPNKEDALRPGTTVHVNMVARSVPDAIVVPATAILKSPEGMTSVMVVGKDGRAHQTPVEVGIQNGPDVQISKGLSGGETLISVGAYGIPDKTMVKAESPSTAKPTAGEDKD